MTTVAPLPQGLSEAEFSDTFKALALHALAADQRLWRHAIGEELYRLWRPKNWPEIYEELK